MLGGEGYNLVFWRWQRDEVKRKVIGGCGYKNNSLM